MTPLILCTCGTSLRVRGRDPLVLEPCPTCLDALRQGVVGKLERLLDETYTPPKAEGSLYEPVPELLRMRYGDDDPEGEAQCAIRSRGGRWPV